MYLLVLGIVIAVVVYAILNVIGCWVIGDVLERIKRMSNVLERIKRMSNVNL